MLIKILLTVVIVGGLFWMLVKTGGGLC